MDLNQLTEKSQAALAEAQHIATRHQHQAVDVEHLLLALLEQEQRVADGLVEGLVPGERAELDALCERRVAPYREQMTDKVMESTLRRCRQTEIRRRCRLPRLSLLVD